MTRLFMLGGLLFDVAGSTAAIVNNCDQVGVPVWIGVNVLLLAVPLAIRIVEPLSVAMSTAPDVLTID